MIVQAIVSALSALVSYIGDLMPTMDVGSFFDNIASNVSTVTGSMAALGNWVPFNAAGTATQFVVAAAGVAIVVRIVRVVVALFTGGGGTGA